MATGAPSASSAEELALLAFAKSTLDLLTFWPALRLCISQGWGGPSGRTHLAEDIVDLFYTTALADSQDVPEEDDIEAVLLHVLSHEFSLTLEDSSEQLIARDLVRLWKECLVRASGSTAATAGLVEAFASAAEKARNEDGVRGYEAQRQGESEDEDGSDDDDDDDEDEDDEMEGVEEGESSSRTRQGPVIDEDGFELVTKGRR